MGDLTDDQVMKIGIGAFLAFLLIGLITWVWPGFLVVMVWVAFAAMVSAMVMAILGGR